MKNNIIKKICRHIYWIILSMKDYKKINKFLDKDTNVFITHNMDISGGAPVVLLELIKELIKNKNLNAILISEKPGDLSKECEKHEIQYFYCYGMYKLFLKKIIKKNVKSIEINTITLLKMIKYINKKNYNNPVMWWIHEEGKIIKKYRNQFNFELNNNVKVLCVSNRVKESLISNEFKNNDKITIFYYGCKDEYNENLVKNKNNKFQIAVIGRICKRKNQLEVIKAYKLLDDNIKDNIIIRLISGSADEDYLNEIIRYSNNENINIQFEGPYKREKMMKIYNEIDLLICSSIDDPLPAVVTEAMMLKCPIIVSSQIGQYDFIQDGINGYRYEINNLEELKEKILRVIKNKENLNILEEGRKNYLRFFTVQECANRYMNLLEGKIYDNKK